MIKILKAFFIVFLLCQNVFAVNCGSCERYNPKRQIEIDNMLETRLNLTNEQKNYIKEVRPKNRREIEPIVKQMQKKHDEIAKIYMLGLPKFQTDLRTAPLKAELVVLKQNAKTIRENHRKNFENILTDEQKIEFEKIKKELILKRTKQINK